MKIITEKQFRVVNEPKHPSDYSNHVGVEIEFISACNEFELKQHLIHSELDKYVTIKHDGSIRPTRKHPFEYEFNIIAKETEIYEVVEKVCKILKSVDSKVNKSCGLHVHVDMRSRDIATVFYNLVNAQSLLYSMNPPSRMQGSYSVPRRGNDWNRERTSGDRTGINPHAFSRHQTLEIRIHAGSLNYNKINNWILLLTTIASKGERIAPSEKVQDFYSAYQLGEPMIEYIEKRLARFKADKNKLPQVTA